MKEFTIAVAVILGAFIIMATNPCWQTFVLQVLAQVFAVMWQEAAYKAKRI